MSRDELVNAIVAIWTDDRDWRLEYNPGEIDALEGDALKTIALVGQACMLSMYDLSAEDRQILLNLTQPEASDDAR